MTIHDRNEIERISKAFASGFIDIPIKGSGMMIVDPLSAHLSLMGYKNKLHQLPENDTRPLILIMEFPDGTQFIPAGSDIPIDGVKDWLWI